MPLFRHSPSSRILSASGARAARYRRSSRFVELTTPESSESHRIAPDSLEPGPLHPDTTTSPSEGTQPTPTSRIGRPTESVTPPTGTVAEVLAWVDDDADRRKAALEAELAGKNRVTLLRELER